MRKLLYIGSILFLSNIYATTFEHLKKIEINPFIVTINYNAQTTEVISESYDRLVDPNASYFQLMIKTELTNDNKIYYVFFGPGPSCDPEFLIDDDLDLTNGYIARFQGNNLYIPSNGAIYVEQRSNKWFNEKRKYILKDGQISECKQPYNYVGIKSKTLEDLKIYSEMELKNEIASLPTGHSVEILLEKDNKYLICTEFGLIGWCKVNAKYIQCTTFNELFYHGD